MSEVPAYFSQANPDLLRSIPPDSRRILEVGCGTGALASAFKRINPKCEYWGIEGDFYASEEARKNADLDEVIQARVENFLVGPYNRDEKFDAFVFGDVLEHLEHPDEVLKELLTQLEPGGSVVACVPNVQYYGVILTLLNGQWPWMESGHFDATHLRWFTRDSLVDMFEQAGLTIAKVFPRQFEQSGHERLVEAVEHFGLVADVERFRKEVQAFQYVVHAVKGEIPGRKVLVRAFPAEACCARPRLTEPGNFLATIPGFRYSEVKTQVEPGESVIVVRQRFNITPEAAVEHLKHGQLIVGEWDDDPWYEGFDGKLKTPSVEWALKACHAISVSTEAIAELVRPINPNVAVFPNQIAAVGPKREHVESDVVRVYIGGQRKREDWEGTVAGVNKVVAANPDAFEFVVVHDRPLYDAIESKHKTFYAFQPYDKYRALLRTCDVALNSLSGGRFNQCKSDITTIECAAEGVAPINSGLNEPHMTIAALMHFLGRKSRAHAAASDWRSSTVDRRMLAYHYKKRAEWFNRLLDAKPELDRQLFERLPELKEVAG